MPIGDGDGIRPSQRFGNGNIVMCMQRWIDAYVEGRDTNDAQVKVRKFSSTKYTVQV